MQVATEGQQEIRLDIGEVAEIGQAEVVYDSLGRMSSGHLQVQEEYRALDSNHQQVCVAHLDLPGKVGTDRISVQFAVDERRVLLATVEDLLTGKVLVERAEIAKLK